MSGVAVLPQAVGYAVVLGIGFFFAALMLGVSWIFNRYSETKSGSSEEFTSASRSVKPGLLAAGIVSAWTWAATLLQSSAVGYKFGLSGPYWYAAGACVQVMLFAMNAAKLKKHAPDAHTFLEVIGARWGKAAHFTFMFFGLLTNVIVSSMLILGGSAAVTDLTGINTLAACFLIPTAVCSYVFVGGIRSALFCDYIHTTVLLTFILVFMFSAYVTSSKIGSPTRMWELLQEAAARNPVEGNAEGSYLTLRSISGLIFGIVNLVGNFSTVFADQSYWQRAVASRPSTAVKAFSLGGTAWFAVPFGMATVMGLTAVALTSDPDFPRYPSALSPQEVSAGLPAPAAAAALMGQTGAILLLVVLFLAVVSTSAAEMVAVAGIGTFDIYKRYFNPAATSKQILWINRSFIVGWALCMGVFGLVWFYIGISMGWLYVCMGTLIGSCVVPIALAITSVRANKWGCIVGAWAGLAAGLVAWLATTAALNNGEISITTTGQDYSVLAGNLAAIGVGAICSVGATLIWPENCDFELVQQTIAGYSTGQVEESGSRSPQTEEKFKKIESSNVSAQVLEQHEESGEVVLTPAGESIQELDKAFRFAAVFSVTTAVILLLVIPLPLFFSSHVYSAQSFTAWIAVAFIWVFYAIGAAVLYPLYEYRSELAATFKKIRQDITGKR